MCDGVLAKPFEPQLVIARVKELLGLAGLPHHSSVKRDDVAVAAPGPGATQAVTGNRGLSMPAPNRQPFEELDDYFERLDRAFASRSATLPAEAPETSLSYASSHSDFERVRRPDNVGGADLERSNPQSPPLPSTGVPPLAELFSALLAAERSMPAPAVTPNGLAAGDVVDEAVRRVLAQLSDRVVRDTIADLVSETAERLVREEIERIKSSIK